MHPQLMGFGDRFADGGDHFLAVASFRQQRLRHHDQLLRSIHVDGERRAAALANRFVTQFHGPLDVLGIVIKPVDDDHVLDAARYENEPVLHETQVARAEEGSFSRIGQRGAERLVRILGPVPVAIGHRGTRHPDLSDCVGGTLQPRFRIDDEDARVVACPA